MLASDIMTQNPVTVRTDTPIAEAISRMIEGRISGVFVLDDARRLTGVMTEGDLLRRVELGTEQHHAPWIRFLRGPGASATDYVRARSLLVGDVMTPDVHSIDAGATLDQVVTLMQKRGIKRVPVLREGFVVGVISRSDLVRALAGALARPDGKPHHDAEIRAAILAEIEAQDWGSMCNIAVTVTNGLVRLDGVAQTEMARMAARVAAERVPGVTGVANDIAVFEPVPMSVGV